MMCRKDGGLGRMLALYTQGYRVFPNPVIRDPGVGVTDSFTEESVIHIYK